MQMKILVAGLFFLSIMSARADQATANAQQMLKDQGFYYGQVTGEKTADTSAAVRRYQIRNGLQITGELNDETLQSLRKAPSAPSASAATPAPPATVTSPVRPEADVPDLRDDHSANSNSVQPNAAVPFNREPPLADPDGAGPSGSGMFSGTPFATAPTEVQTKVIVDAQKILARRGLFKYQIDGVIGSDMEFSIRAYQARIGLRPTGRLDLETLAALELLPGAHERVYTPRRSYPPGAEPPVRGEWIRP